MAMRTAVAVLGTGLATGLVAACGSAPVPTADLAKIAGVKASFGPQFKVTEVDPTGIDPTPDQWSQIADLCIKKKHVPFFDVAYQVGGGGVGFVGRKAVSLRRHAW